MAVYILCGPRRELYIGVTGNLARRLRAHRERTGSKWASAHGVTRLVYVEFTDRPLDAIRREKQLKGWCRRRKLALVERTNPEWHDLGSLLLGEADASAPSLRSG